MIIHPNDSCSLSQGVNCILEPNKGQFKQLVVNYSVSDLYFEVLSQGNTLKMISPGFLVSCILQ